VDIEWLSPRDFVGMARVAYSESEADALASLGHPDLLREAFYELWTLKEAFAKALQLPLVDSLRHCRLPVVGRVTGSTSIPTDQAWRATVFAPRPRLRLAVVAVAPTRDALSTALTTLEWPPFHPGEWPAVRRLEGAGGHADAAC
jgi:phosphopantetheinyl transferase